MRQLIEDLLTSSDVARPAARGGGRPRHVAPQVLADLAPTIDATGAEVVHGPLPTAWGHRSLLGQVLQNVVGQLAQVRRVTSSRRDPDLRARDARWRHDPDRRQRHRGGARRSARRCSASSPVSTPTSGTRAAASAWRRAPRSSRPTGLRSAIEDGLDGGMASSCGLPTPPAKHRGPG